MTAELEVLQDAVMRLERAGVPYMASPPEGLDPAEKRFRLCERFYGELAARAFPRRKPLPADP